MPGIANQPQAQLFRNEVSPLPAPISENDQLAAAFALENVVASAGFRATEPRTEDVAGFDPFQNLQPGEEFIAGEFADAGSSAEMAVIRTRIERESRARFLLDKGPINSFLASTVAIAADPTTYIPFGGGAVKGASFGARLARGAVVAAAETAASEAVLQATQQTRSTAESLSAVILGGAFGLGLAGAGAAIGGVRGRAAYTAAVEDMDAVMRAIAPEEVPGPPAPAGAAVAPRGPDEDSLLAGGTPVRRTIEAVGRGLDRVRMAAPSLRLSVSRSALTRRLINRMVDTGMVTEGVARGVRQAPSVENRIKRYERTIITTHNALVGAHSAFVAAGGKTSRREFFEAVGRSMRRGDTDAIPQVAEAAKELRRTVISPLKDRAIQLGLLPEGVDVKTAASYFTRVYNRGLIKAKRPDFKARIVRWLERQGDPDQLAGGRGELDELANGIIDTILGSPAGRVPLFNVPAARGPLKERTFNIPDAEIEDFLESNAMSVTARYIRTLSADIEFKREFGDLDLAGTLKEISDEFTAKAAAETDPKRAANITAEGEREVSIFRELSNQIRGVNSRPFDPAYIGLGRVARTARNFNFMRLLGSVLISSVPDVGRIVMEEGLTRTVGRLAVEFGNGFKGIRLAVKEAQAAGTALDMVNSQRMASMFDLSERFGGESRFEEIVEAGAAQFGRLTLLNHWNTALKGITSVLVSTRVLNAAKQLSSGGTLSGRDLRKLAQAGIDPAMARRIAAQADKFEEVGGAVLANTEDWTDAAARDAFRDALLRDVDNTIITPGRGDAPLWTSTEWGKTVFQFKRFASASTQRILIAGLQVREMETLNGLLVMVALGALGTAARDMTFARPDKPLGEVQERTASQWVADAVDRSGVASMLFEANNIMEKAAGVSPVSAVTGKEVSRFAGRDLVGQTLGPTAGLFAETAGSVRSAIDGDFTQSDLHRFRKLAPAQNLFYLRWLLDEMESGAGLPDNSRRRRPPPANLPTNR